jgi:hypothetical protein
MGAEKGSSTYQSEGTDTLDGRRMCQMFEVLQREHSLINFSVYKILMPLLFY